MSEKDTVDQFGWHRRRAAAYRLPPLTASGGLAGHDPHARGWKSRPSTYSLTPSELRAHAHALRAAGWTHAEISVVLDLGAVTT